MKSFGNIAKDGQVRAIASGAMTDGKAVIVNADGTVSDVGGQSDGIGSETVFSSSNTTETRIVYDPDSDKHIIAYKDAGNSNYGKAKVATVSGTGVSFGSATTFESAETKNIAITYDTANDKVVIAYVDGADGDKGKAIVGTVSGTSISFGTAATFEADSTDGVSITYDTNASKVLIIMQSGSIGVAYVGTVSGTDISFGDAATFTSKHPNEDSIDSVYDETAEKHVITFSDEDDGVKGYIKVGTISGTDVTFGNAAFLQNAYTSHNSLVRDPVNNKTVAFYKDDADSDKGNCRLLVVSGTSVSTTGSETQFGTKGEHVAASYDVETGKILVVHRDNPNGTLRVGTISGTSISFETAEVFNSASTTVTHTSYDPVQKSHLISYRDIGNSNYGTAIVKQIGSTNLTSENFIGFSDGAFATTQSAAINTTSTIDRNQSGLTAGQTYFVQIDGTLGTTADDPSVTAGTAISATEIIVKG